MSADPPATLRCPTCGRTVALEIPSRPASFPFCSSRCRLQDLGAWFDGKHVIPSREPSNGDEPTDRPLG
ncbi:MAG: DNA gyrase inhibitor YacG [Planctomycetota bacterium]